MAQSPTLPAGTARLADLAVALAAVSFAAWTAFVSGGRSTPVLLLVAGLGASMVGGRVLSVRPAFVPKIVAAATAGALLLSYPGVRAAGGAPTGYANSNAALAVVGVLAAVGAARAVPPGPERRSWTGLAAVLAGTLVLTRSVAGLLVLAFVGALLAGAERWRWPSLVAVGGTVAVSIALGLTVLTSVDSSVALESTEAVRVSLWSAAAELAGEQPVRGLGAGAFESRNPVTDDADLRWVHHEYLELAVEVGGVGLLLVFSLGLAAMMRLAAAADGTIGAAALTAIALHGTVDHVWHAPAVLLCVALLVGGSTGPRTSGVVATVRGRDSERMGPLTR